MDNEGLHTHSQGGLKMSIESKEDDRDGAARGDAQLWCGGCLAVRRDGRKLHTMSAGGPHCPQVFDEFRPMRQSLVSANHSIR